MLLQLSTERGVNTDNIINWKVSRGRVVIWVVGQGCSVQGLACLTLDCDESFQFLQYVTYSSPWLEVETRNRLLGVKETDDDKVNAE